MLNNLGMFAYWEGRWERRSSCTGAPRRPASAQATSWAAAYGDCNIGEVLADQGRLAEAQERLRRARRVWHGTEDAHGVAFTSALLGRLAARDGRPAEAGDLLEGAARSFRELQMPGDAALVGAYQAEAALLAGDAGQALELAGRQLEQGDGPRVSCCACAAGRFSWPATRRPRPRRSRMHWPRRAPRTSTTRSR